MKLFTQQINSLNRNEKKYGKQSWDRMTKIQTERQQYKRLQFLLISLVEPAD